MCEKQPLKLSSRFIFIAEPMIGTPAHDYFANRRLPPSIGVLKMRLKHLFLKVLCYTLTATEHVPRLVCKSQIDTEGWVEVYTSQKRGGAA